MRTTISVITIYLQVFLLKSCCAVANHDIISSQLLAKIKASHAKAVESAKAAYSSKIDDLKSDQEFDIESIKFNSLSISNLDVLPDLSFLFSNPCIHTTDSSTPLFTSDECDYVVDAANKWFQKENDGIWGTLQSGRYEVSGFWIKDIPSVHSWFKNMLRERLFPGLRHLFPELVEDISCLVCDNAYLFKYTPETGLKTDVHTDSGCLSFTIALNDRSEYEGGGTWFDLSRSNSNDVEENSCQIIHMDKGCVTFRPGGVRHRGESVTKGVRYIIGGFVMDSSKIEPLRMLMGIAQNGSLEEAEEAYRAAIQLNPLFDAAYINLADCLTKQKRVKEAMEVLERARKNNPLNAEASYTLGMMKKTTGDLNYAYDCFLSCLKADQYDAEAMMALAVLSSELKDREAERKWFNRIIHSPGVKAETMASAFTNLGVMLGESGNREEEIVLYQKALTFSPTSFHTRHSLALAYGEDKQYDDAIKEFQMALQYCPQDSPKRCKVLKDLYLVTAMKVNADPKVKSLSQDAVLDLFRNSMGSDNYNELISTMRK